MEFQEFVDKAKEIKAAYRKINKKRWGVAEYTQGLVGDVGDLVKLVMAKNEFREVENLEERLAHELSDCLWSIIVIADELGIDLEGEFENQMDILKERIDREGK